MAVHVRRRDAVAIITLDRQEVLNALSFAMLREIGDAIDQVAQSDARALIVTGAGPKAFCAGADIKELRGRDPKIKFIFVSGYAEEAFAKNLPSNEQYAFLAKPFTLKQLVAQVKETLAGKN